MADPYGRPIWQTHMADPSATCVIQNQSNQTWRSDERAIAALLLSPPSVIA
eukprot:COSAG05_NODE_27389_length_155_cov_367.392857_1_plen_50_part_10